MRYYSDVTRKFYEDPDACKEAEEAYKAEQEKKEAEALRKSNERKEAAKKVEDAYNALAAAKKAYNDELSAFCKKYGSFHMTLSTNDIEDWISSFWECFF